MEKNISLVYMVAGMSSRFGWRIKQFAKVWPNDSTLIEYSLSQALPAWFSKIVFIVWKMTEWPFKEMFGDNYQWIPVEYAKQTFDEADRDRPWGTVDAVCSALPCIDWPFVVCNGDDIYGKNSFKILYDHLANNPDELCTLWYILWNVIPEVWSTNRWIFTVENWYVKNINETIWIEKSKLSEFGLTLDALCSMNIFGLNRKALEMLSEILAEFKKEHVWDRRIECYLPVELTNIIKNKWVNMKIYSTPDQWFGVTNPDDEAIVKKQIEEYEKK